MSEHDESDHRDKNQLVSRLNYLEELGLERCQIERHEAGAKSIYFSGNLIKIRINIFSD